MTANSLCFFLLKLTRAVRWGRLGYQNSNDFKRNGGQRGNTNALPVVASLYLFGFLAIRVTTGYFFLTFYLALLSW